MLYIIVNARLGTSSASALLMNMCTVHSKGQEYLFISVTYSSITVKLKLSELRQLEIYAGATPFTQSTILEPHAIGTALLKIAMTRLAMFEFSLGCYEEINSISKQLLLISIFAAASDWTNK